MKTTKTMAILAAVIGLAMAAAVRADNVTWAVGGSGVWDTATANWGGDDTFYADGDTATFSNTAGGNISLTANRAPASTTVDAASGTYTFTGSSITSGSLTKSGSGVLTLSNAANSFSGITLAGGELQYSGGSNRLGGGSISVTNDATLTVLGNYGVANPMTIALGKTLTMKSAGATYALYSGKIDGGGGLSFTGGAGNPSYIQNASNTFAGDITISSPAIFTSDGAMGGATKTIYLNGGTWFQWIGSAGAGRTLSLSGTPQLRGNAGTTWNGLVTGTGWTFQGSQIILTNPGNSFVGNIGMYAGYGSTLTVSDPGNINGNLVNFVNPYNRLQIDGTPAGNWTGNVTCNTYATSFDVVQSAAVVNWTGQISGSGLLTKTGPGAFVVNNTAATGDFDIQGGSVVFNDATTANVGTHTVQSGAALDGTGVMNLASGKGISVLGGGSFLGSITVNGGTGVTVADNGIVSPGNSAGTLTVSTLALSNGSVLNFELAAPNVAGGVNDLIQVNGDLTLDGVLNVNFTSAPVILEPYRLFNYTGVLTDNTLTLGTGFPKNGLIDLSVANQVNLILVPEPATVTVLGLAGLLALRRRR